MLTKNMKKNFGGRPPTSDAEKRRHGTWRPSTSAAARARRRGDGPLFKLPSQPPWWSPAMRQQFTELWDRVCANRDFADAAAAAEYGAGMVQLASFGSWRECSRWCIAQLIAGRDPSPWCLPSEVAQFKAWITADAADEAAGRAADGVFREEVRALRHAARKRRR
jgi:hypothetical protein